MKKIPAAAIAFVTVLFLLFNVVFAENDLYGSVLMQNSEEAEGQYISRAEFAVSLFNATQITSYDVKSYDDVNENDDFYTAIANLSGTGIVSGESEKLFNPYGILTFEQAAVMTVKAYEYLNGTERVVRDISDKYKALADSSEWAYEYVKKAVNYNLFGNILSEGFSPQDLLSKDDASVIITNLLLCIDELGERNRTSGGTSITKIEQTKIGNIFVEGEEVNFTLESDNKTVEIVVYDYWDIEVYRSLESIDSKKNVTIPINTPGWYYAEILGEDESNQKTVKAKTTFAIISPYDFMSVEDSDFGICTHFDRVTYGTGWDYALFDLIYQMGAKSIRDGFEWRNSEQVKGVVKINPNPLRDYLDKYNMSLLAVTGYICRFYDENSTPYTDVGREAFANFVVEMVDQFGPRLKYVDIYNEFYGKFGKYGNGIAFGKPEYWYPLLKTTYTALKARNPETIGLSNVIMGYDNWYEKTLKLGGGNYGDGLFLHPYFSVSAPENVLDKLIGQINDLNDKYNAKCRDVWITETGATTIEKTEKEQAQYVPRAYGAAKANNVKKMYWYDLMDDGVNPGEREHFFGFLHNLKSEYGAYTPKPSYVSYSVMTRQLTDKVYKDRKVIDGNLYDYTFANDNEKLHILSTLSDNQDIVIKTNEPVEVTSIMGDTYTLYPVNNEVVLTVTEDVVYIKGDIDYKTESRVLTDSEDKFYANTYMNVNINVDQAVPDNNIDIYINGNRCKTENRTANAKIYTGSALGRKEIVSEIRVGGRLYGRIQKNIEIAEGFRVNIAPNITDFQARLCDVNVKFINESNDSVSLNYIDWKVGKAQGRQLINTKLDGKSEKEIIIPLPEAEFAIKYNADLKFCINSKPKSLIYNGSIEFCPIQKHTIKVDGEIDNDILDMYCINMDKEAEYKELLNGAYRGASDLGGRIWTFWDNENLYLAAEVTDDINVASEQGSTIWKEDSLQFAIYADAEGYTSSNYFEMGTNSNGRNEVYRWKSAVGGEAGFVKNAQVCVKRKEEKMQTVYEIAIPWTELNNIQPEKTDTIKLSILSNDADTDGRKGWLEWGSGIGTDKDVNLFRTCFFVVK